MNTFTYESIDLEKPGVRLLRLHGGSDVNIKCELFQAYLDDDNLIPYEALSYTWGGTDLVATVQMNGVTFRVTQNLYFALEYLRSQETDRILWVDAVCIHQNDLRERTHQVRQMGRIFSQADQVIFWLGLATNETNVLMRDLKEFEQKARTITTRSWSSTDERWMSLWSSLQPVSEFERQFLATRHRDGVKEILDRPWFRRAWILQEVANAKRATVCCGPRSVSARIFSLVPFLIRVSPSPHCQAVLDIMPGVSRKYSWWNQHRDLYTLLSKFKESEASDQRDMIYALLGICSDAQVTNGLSADYTKTPQQIIQDTTFLLFGIENRRFRKMSEFLYGLTTFVIPSLCMRAEFRDANDIAHFLAQYRDTVKAKGELLEAAARNTRAGVEIISLLLDHFEGELVVTSKVLETAKHNGGCGKEIIEFLLKRREYQTLEAAKGCTPQVMKILLEQLDDVHVLEGLVNTAAQNQQHGKEIITFLIKKRWNGIEITEEVVTAMTENPEWGIEIVALLLEWYRSEGNIPEALIAVAATRGQTFLELLIKYPEEDMDITEYALGIIVAQCQSKDTVAFFLEKSKGRVEITEGILMTAARNEESGREILELLLDRRSDEVKISEDITKVAAKNVVCGYEIIELFFQRRRGEIRITEEVIVAAAGNHNHGQKIMELLFTHQGSEIKITDEIIKKAAGNLGNGKEILEFLIGERGEEIKFTEDVIKIAVNNLEFHSPTFGYGILKLLCGQQEVAAKNMTEILARMGAEAWRRSRVLVLFFMEGRRFTASN